MKSQYETSKLVILDLREKASYWRTQHQSDIKREAVWMEKASLMKNYSFCRKRSVSDNVVYLSPFLFRGVALGLITRDLLQICVIMPYSGSTT